MLILIEGASVMAGVRQAVILAAGRGNQSDGIAKVLIRHPSTGKTILEHAVDAFAGKRVILVVGFRAIQIMEHQPQLDYVINHDWAITNNAMSLGLALTEEPTYVVSGDIFFDRKLIKRLDALEPNLVLTETRENRTLSAIHCVLRKDGSLAETYQGPVRDIMHPEAVGLFKISDKQLLQRWKRLCISHGNLFAGQILPCDGEPIFSVPLAGARFDEINTPTDYMRLIEQCSTQ
jgi:choline kinase